MKTSFALIVKSDNDFCQKYPEKQVLNKETMKYIIGGDGGEDVLPPPPKKP